MTILAAAQGAIARLVGERPAAVVSSTDQICVEMTALALDAAREIASGYDWQELIRFHSITADGETTSYPLPSDYDRMVQAAEVLDPDNWCWGYQHVPNPVDWLHYQLGEVTLIQPGIWSIRESEFQFYPAPPAQAQAVFPYITKNIFRDQGGTPKDTISADTDEFRLSEQLLTLALIWKYKSLKGLDYSQEIDDYNLALSQRLAKDRGGRTIRSRRPGRGYDARYALPWSLSE